MLREQEKLSFNLPQMKCDEFYYVWKEKQRGAIVLICKIWAVSAQRRSNEGFVLCLGYDFNRGDCEKKKLYLCGINLKNRGTPSIFLLSSYAMSLGLQLASNATISSTSSHPVHRRLTTLPLISRAELFCNICWCGPASKCCRIVLLLELFFFADRWGEEPTIIGYALQSLILLIDTAFHKHIFYVDASRGEGV